MQLAGKDTVEVVNDPGIARLEIINEVVGAVVVPSSQAARDAGTDAPKAFANNLADLLQDLNRAPRLAA